MTPDRMIWILGATSAIAHAYERRRAERGARLLLIGRNEAHLRANAGDLVARGAPAASTRTCDLARPLDHDAIVSEMITSNGGPDEVLIAYGTLEQPGRALHDTNYARQLIDTSGPNLAEASQRLRAISENLDKTTANLDKLMADHREDLGLFLRDSLPEMERLLRDSRQAAQEFAELSRSLKADPSQLLYEPTYRGVEIPR